MKVLFKIKIKIIQTRNIIQTGEPGTRKPETQKQNIFVMLLITTENVYVY